MREEGQEDVSLLRVVHDTVNFEFRLYDAQLCEQRLVQSSVAGLITEQADAEEFVVVLEHLCAIVLRYVTWRNDNSGPVAGQRQEGGLNDELRASRST